MAEGKKKGTDGAKLEDSNIANYGSKDHKAAALAAAQTEKAWEGAGKAPGIQIWRIEKFKVIDWPKDKYGSFFSGDSYICLHTYKSPENPDKLLFNIHFWLGKDSTQDEMGTAAYKTVELDDLLGQLPVQYRETEGNETDTFLALFGGTIKTMKGGVDSGFNYLKPTEYKPKLLWMKGKSEKCVRVKEVPCAASSLNDGDVFLLDCGMQIYQWNGKSAGLFEKRKAMTTIEALKKERNGKPKSLVVDGLEDSAEFWKLLGGKPSKVADATPDDVKIEKRPKSVHKVSDSTGKLTVTKVGEGDIKRTMLDTNDAFIVDDGVNVFAWIGAKASVEERRNAVKFGVDYCLQNGLPNDTRVSRVLEGSEKATAGFTASF